MKTNSSKILIQCMAVLCAFSLKAQVATTYTFSQILGTYSAITGGTVFNSPTSDDEVVLDPAVPGGIAVNANGPGMPIGFNFVYNNNVFDRVGISNNGYILFGNSAQGNNAVQHLTTGANNHLRPISFTSTSPPANQHRVAALGNDLQGQPTSNMRLETMGTAPTRTFVAQWDDYRPYNPSNNGDTLKFQIRLYETTNIIDVIYGKIISVTLDTTSQVGLRGGANTDFNNRSVSGSLTWITSVAGTTNTHFCRYNNLLFPPNGLTFRWAPAQCSGILASLTPTGLGLVCPGGTSTVSFNGFSGTSGITYTWTSSTSSSVGLYTPINNANGTSYNTPVIPQTTWYQVLYTCVNSAVTTTSNPFEVQVAGTSFSTVPYYEGFESILFPDQLPNCSWLTTNTLVCQTYTTGAIYNRWPKTGTKFASFKAPTNPSGDYYFSNGIQLYPGVTYSAAVNFIADGFPGWSELSIMIGNAQTAGSMVGIVSETPVTSYTYKLLKNTFTVASPGIYYVGIKAVGSGTAKYLSWDDLSITIPCNLNPMNPLVSASSPSVCSSNSVNITVSGADTYTWNTGDQTNSIDVFPPANTIYTVVATSTLTGCTKTLTQGVIVYASPVIGIAASSTTLCAGGTATLYAFGANSFLWSTGSTNYYAIVTASATSIYTVKGSNARCTTEEQFTLSVVPGPTINVSTNRPGLCVGEEATLQGLGGLTYLWFSPNSSVKSGSLVPVQPLGPTVYTVTGTDAKGCSNTTTFLQNVNACTGIGELNGKNGMTVYPNPTNSEITLTGYNSGSNFTLHDVTGRLLMNGELTSETVTLNLTEVPDGVYYLSVKSDVSQEVIKIIKQ